MQCKGWVGKIFGCCYHHIYNVEIKFNQPNFRVKNIQEEETFSCIF